MASYRYLILISLFLSSCAQVGTISGGEVDNSAPKPIASKVNPPNETIHFNSKSIEIPFDEFIQLNNPGENIVMVPPHATVNARVNGKTLFLDWEEDLNPNTTYAVYLNNAVRDITESNDTLIQYVFSTGSNIDSLTYSVKVLDAWTNQPVKKCLVGLYDAETNEIVSFSNTSSSGDATLRYLPSKKYDIVAFIDENNDLSLQNHEKIAFPIESSIALTESIIDSVPLRLFVPKTKSFLRSTQFVRPGKLLLGSNNELKTASVLINGVEVKSSNIKTINSDSLAVFFNATDLKNLDLIVKSADFTDTSKVRISNSEQNLIPSLRCFNTNNQFAPSEKISFLSSDLIESVDTSLIEVMNLSDSSFLEILSVELEQDQLYLSFDKNDVSNVAVLFKKGALVCTHGANNEQKFNLELLADRKFGRIIFDLKSFETPIILQLIKGGKVIREKSIESPDDAYSISELIAGEYTVKIIQDSNGNKKWDVGDYELKLQPESIYYFSAPIKVRSNWDIDVLLEKN